MLQGERGAKEGLLEAQSLVHMHPTIQNYRSFLSPPPGLTPPGPCTVSLNLDRPSIPPLFSQFLLVLQVLDVTSSRKPSLPPSLAVPPCTTAPWAHRHTLPGISLTSSCLSSPLDPALLEDRGAVFFILNPLCLEPCWHRAWAQPGLTQLD